MWSWRCKEPKTTDREGGKFMRRQSLERTILFLCDDNSCLSQIAEAAARHLAPPRTRVFSAGVKPSTIPAPVVQAMQELGISMSGQRSKSLADVPIQDVDLVVSFGEADKHCDRLPQRVKIERWPIADPAANPENPSALPAIRARRDEIDKRVFALFLDHWRNIPRPS
jgi:arsenate reductase